MFCPCSRRCQLDTAAQRLADTSASGSDSDWSGDSSDELEDVRRGRTASWANLPQDRRGITLRELWRLYRPNRAWLEARRWRCCRCGLVSESSEGPCSACEGTAGAARMRDLYEVNARLIMPLCKSRRVSYVELLTESRGHCHGVAVDTFVSHWWGEEFPVLVQSLDRYARLQCVRERPAWAYIVAHTLCAVVLPTCLSAALVGTCQRDTIKDCELWACSHALLEMIALRHPFDSWGSICFRWILIGSLVSKLSLVFVHWMTGRAARRPLTWSFWICAFANNQFAIENAISDVHSSAFATALSSKSIREAVAVVDGAGTIYTRAWCAFELFYATVVIPRRAGRCLEVKLVNQHGVVSQGDGTLADVDRVTDLMGQVRTADCQASQYEDLVMIREAMRQESIDFEDLDIILRNIASSARVAVHKRQWYPLGAFTLAPLVAATMSTSIWVMVRFLFDRRKLLEPKHWRVYERANSGLLFFFCLGFYYFQLELESLQEWKRRAWRTLLGLMLPVLSAVAMLEISQHFSTPWRYGDELHLKMITSHILWHNVFAFNVLLTLLLACEGLVFGTIYSLVRNVSHPSTVAFRRWIEGIIFG